MLVWEARVSHSLLNTPPSFPTDLTSRQEKIVEEERQRGGSGREGKVGGLAESDPRRGSCTEPRSAVQRILRAAEVDSQVLDLPVLCGLNSAIATVALRRHRICSEAAGLTVSAKGLTYTTHNWHCWREGVVEPGGQAGFHPLGSAGPGKPAGGQVLLYVQTGRPKCAHEK